MSLRYDGKTGWFWSGERRVGATTQRNGYVYVRFQGRSMIAHRVAWFLTHGEWPEEDIDHINGDRADNRLANLRLATRGQNLANKAHRSSTGFKGVGVHPNPNRAKRFGASLTKDGRRYFLGWYETAELAGAAYARAAEMMHKEFATTRRKTPQQVRAGELQTWLERMR